MSICLETFDMLKYSSNTGMTSLPFPILFTFKVCLVFYILDSLFAFHPQSTEITSVQVMSVLYVARTSKYLSVILLAVSHFNTHWIFTRFPSVSLASPQSPLLVFLISFFKRLIEFLLYECFCLHVCLCTKGQKRLLGPGTEIPEGCELPCECWGLNPVSLNLSQSLPSICK